MSTIQTTIGSLADLLGKPSSKFAAGLVSMAKKAEKQGLKARLELDHMGGKSIVEVHGYREESRQEHSSREKKEKDHIERMAWRDFIELSTMFERSLFDLFVALAFYRQQNRHSLKPAERARLKKLLSKQDKIEIGTKPVSLKPQTIREMLPHPLAEVWDEKNDPNKIAARIMENTAKAKEKGYTKVWVTPYFSCDEWDHVRSVYLRICGERKETEEEMNNRKKSILARLRMENDGYIRLRKRFEKKVDKIVSLARGLADGGGLSTADLLAIGEIFAWGPVIESDGTISASHSRRLRYLDKQMFAKVVDKTKDED